MIDLGVSKLALIAVVALVVVGPERLPKVARMAGNLFGRAQRYMAEVRSEVNRQIELDEFKKLREDSAAAIKDVESSLNSTFTEAGTHLSDQADSYDYSTSSYPVEVQIDENKVFRDSLRQGRSSWRVRQAAQPLWYKHASGVRLRVQSGAARMKRFRHIASQ
jgi:sec-independent protein translocase protein TatB